MTLQNQRRRWRVCLFVTAAASVNSQLYLQLDSYHGHGVSVTGSVTGGQRTSAPVISLCRGGSRSYFPGEQPPPPPPRRPPPVPKTGEKQQKQQGRPWSGRNVPPPPPQQQQQQPPFGEQSYKGERPQLPPSLSHVPQRSGLSFDNSAFPKSPLPRSHFLDSESLHAAWRPPSPPSRTLQNHVKNRDPLQKLLAPPASHTKSKGSQVHSTVKTSMQVSKTEDSATTNVHYDSAFVRLPEDDYDGSAAASVGDRLRRNGPFDPRPNDDGGVFVGDTRNAPFGPRPNGGSSSANAVRSSSPSFMDKYHIMDKHLEDDTDIRTVLPRQDLRALLETSDFILVSPENVEELNRISLKTGIRPKEDRRQVATLGSLVNVRHELVVLEQVLQSQESIREEMVAIAQLLRALLTVQQQQVCHDSSLVLHVPQHLAQNIIIATAAAAPRIIARRRRRVEKTRIIPRRTILSTLDNLDRDLSDSEFNVLLHGLMTQPSEAEEVYHEYEYDQEDFLPQGLVPPSIHVTSNQEEFNEFLRETSDSETAEQYYEQDQYDPDFSYDYYDDEPLDELWDEDSLTDMAVGELTKGDILHSDKEAVERSVRDRDDGSPFEQACRENHVPNDNLREDALETPGRLNESSAANGPKDSIIRASTSASQRPPPPPPPRHHSTKGHTHWRTDATPIRPADHCTLPTGARVRTTDERLKKPPPPPPPRVSPHPYRKTPLPPISKLSPELVYEHEESEWSDHSDDLDQVEARLLEDAAINEMDDRIRDEEGKFEDTEDSIDEDDFRILQLSRWTPSDGGKSSRWMPFVGRTKQSFDEEEEGDLFVDEAVYLDETLYDAMTSDDFTDIEGETPYLTGSLVENEESSEDEMILGEPAVTDMPGYTGNHFGGPKLNSNAPLAQHGNGHLRSLPPPPPPPRPPPRQVSVHNASKMHSAMQRPHVQPAFHPQLAMATGQSMPPYLSQQHELHDRRTSRAPAIHSPYRTGYPNTHANPPSHNARDTRHPNADAEKSQYKR